jgi:hypothetical protein
VRSRADVDYDLDYDSRDDRAATDVGHTDHDDALLIGSFLPETRQGHATACPYFFLSVLRNRSFGSLGFFFRLANYRRDGL